jgi:hypothetical protein
MGSLFFDLKDKEMGGEYEIEEGLNMIKLIFRSCNESFDPSSSLLSASVALFIHGCLLQLTESK